MRLGWATEDLKLDASVGIDAKDSGDGWVRVVASDDHELAGNWHETRACVNDPRPQTSVVGHIHEVNCNVVAHAFSISMLAGMFSTWVRDRIVKASVESDYRQLGQIGEHDREVRRVKRGEKRETRTAKPPECRETDLAVVRESLASSARLQHRFIERCLHRDAVQAVQFEHSA